MSALCGSPACGYNGFCPEYSSQYTAVWKRISYSCMCKTITSRPSRIVMHARHVVQRRLRPCYLARRSKQREAIGQLVGRPHLQEYPRSGTWLPFSCNVDMLSNASSCQNTTGYKSLLCGAAPTLYPAACCMLRATCYSSSSSSKSIPPSLGGGVGDLSGVGDLPASASDVDSGGAESAAGV